SMKRILLLCASVLVLAIYASAQATTTVSVAPDAPSKADIQKLFDAMANRQQMQQMIEQLSSQMEALNREQIKKRHPDATDEELSRVGSQSRNLINDFPTYETLSDMLPISQKPFPKSDVHALIDFYSSPAGQKFLHEMPAVTAQTMKAVYPRIQAQVDA